MIYLSCNKHPPKSFMLLCEKGADATKSDKWGNTALMEYLGRGIPELSVIKLLCKNVINNRNEDGLSCLLIAVNNPNVSVEILSELL